MKVLVLHALRSDSRLTTIEHSLSFARHLDGCDVTYVNVFGLMPADLHRQGFDLAILTYELVAQRTMPFWGALVRRLAPLMKAAKVTVVMPQDDYSCSGILDDFVADHDVQFVFSPLTRDLHMLYPRSLARGVQFHEAFTGYWEADTVLPVASFRKPFEQRSIDLGQRVRFLPPQFGPAAQRKGQLAIAFAEMAERAGFVCDVSTEDWAVLIGDDWWRFLGDSRFTVGRLGGASVADPRGRLQAKVTRLQLRKPKITYDEIARRLRTDELPQGDFTAISPRLFECAAMGVCQVLEEAHYVDGFEPWRDYIPLAPDLSNVDEVFAAMRDVVRCKEIADSAEATLIGSGRHTYREFVKRLARVCTGHDIEGRPAPIVHDLDEALLGGADAAFIGRVQSFARRLVIRDRRLPDEPAASVARQWVAAFRRRELIVESMTIPWCPAKPLLASS